MRKLLYTVIGVMLLTACELETSDNGDLDGYWQLTMVDTLSTGGSCDMRERLIFWAVQHKLLEIKEGKTINQNIFFRFNHTSDSLILSEPVIDLRDSSDLVVKDYTILQPYGIYNMPESLHVDHLSSGKMTLASKLFRFHFRKY